jgi:DNA recombination protein RmuC
VLALERRSGEVWKLLSAVRSEFGKYNEVVERLARRLKMLEIMLQILTADVTWYDQKEAS